MTIASEFKTSMARAVQLSTITLSQLENNNLGVKIAGMFFLDDNILCLQKSSPIYEALGSNLPDQVITL